MATPGVQSLVPLALQLCRRPFLLTLATLGVGCARDRRGSDNQPRRVPETAPEPSRTAEERLFERLYYPPEGKLFVRKRPAQEGDWLARFSEPGQSFMAYRAADPVRPTRTRHRLVLQPLGELRPREEEALRVMQDYMRRFFAVSVDIAAQRPLPVKGRRRRGVGAGTYTQHHTKEACPSSRWYETAT